mgnify:CR=1 FL=1
MSTSHKPEHTHTTPEPQSDLIEFFTEKLNHALKLINTQTSSETLSYLLLLLERHLRLDDSNDDFKEELGFERPAAFMLSDAIEAPSSHQIEAYRKLGDACLYNCGFFDARITRRAVSSNYYTRMGKDAYSSVSNLVQRSPGQSSLTPIFHELAHKFDAFVIAFKHLFSGKDPREQLFERIKRGENVSFEELAKAGILLGQSSTRQS